MAQTTVVRALSDALANRWGLLLHEEAVRPACERPAVLVHLGGADSIRIVERYTSMTWPGTSCCDEAGREVDHQGQRSLVG